MNYFMPTRLFTGKDCIAVHKDVLQALGKRCLIVTGGAAATASGALADVEDALAACGVEAIVWDGVTENPPVASCIEAGKRAAETQAEFVLGVGGGSSLDAAKAIAVFAANPSLDESGFYGLAWDSDPLPIALVGTTAGTGSEVTKVSVLTDAARRKHSIHDDRLYATVAFGDSRHTRTCPAAVTLSCGVDVLAHATESYFSKKADEVSRAFSIRAVRLAIGPLEIASTGGDLDGTQRELLYEASILGGLAINTTGTCFPHNVGYYLTESYGVPHGFASAAFMAPMLDFVHDFDPAYADEFFRAAGTTEQDYRSLVARCLPELGIRMSTAEVEAALPRWENNGSVKNTRANVSTEQIREILHIMFVR